MISLQVTFDNNFYDKSTKRSETLSEERFLFLEIYRKSSFVQNDNISICCNKGFLPAFQQKYGLQKNLKP